MVEGVVVNSLVHEAAAELVEHAGAGLAHEAVEGAQAEVVDLRGLLAPLVIRHVLGVDADDLTPGVLHERDVGAHGLAHEDAVAHAGGDFHGAVGRQLHVALLHVVIPAKAAGAQDDALGGLDVDHGAVLGLGLHTADLGHTLVVDAGDEVHGTGVEQQLAAVLVHDAVAQRVGDVGARGGGAEGARHLAGLSGLLANRGDGAGLVLGAGEDVDVVVDAGADLPGEVGRVSQEVNGLGAILEEGLENLGRGLAGGGGGDVGQGVVVVVQALRHGGGVEGHPGLAVGDGGGATNKPCGLNDNDAVALGGSLAGAGQDRAGAHDCDVALIVPRLGNCDGGVRRLRVGARQHGGCGGKAGGCGAGGLDERAAGHCVALHSDYPFSVMPCFVAAADASSLGVCLALNDSNTSALGATHSPPTLRPSLFVQVKGLYTPQIGVG